MKVAVRSLGRRRTRRSRAVLEARAARRLHSAQRGNPRLLVGGAPHPVQRRSPARARYDARLLSSRSAPRRMRHSRDAFASHSLHQPDRPLAAERFRLNESSESSRLQRGQNFNSRKLAWVSGGLGLPVLRVPPSRLLPTVGAGGEGGEGCVVVVAVLARAGTLPCGR